MNVDTSNHNPTTPTANAIIPEVSSADQTNAQASDPLDDQNAAGGDQCPAEDTEPANRDESREGTPLAAQASKKKKPRPKKRKAAERPSNAGGSTSTAAAPTAAVVLDLPAWASPDLERWCQQIASPEKRDQEVQRLRQVTDESDQATENYQATLRARGLVPLGEQPRWQEEQRRLAAAARPAPRPVPRPVPPPASRPVSPAPSPTATGAGHLHVPDVAQPAGCVLGSSSDARTAAAASSPPAQQAGATTAAATGSASQELLPPVADPELVPENAANVAPAPPGSSTTAPLPLSREQRAPSLTHQAADEAALPPAVDRSDWADWVALQYDRFAAATMEPGDKALWMRILYLWIAFERLFGWANPVRKCADIYSFRTNKTILRK